MEREVSEKVGGTIDIGFCVIELCQFFVVPSMLNLLEYSFLQVMVAIFAALRVDTITNIDCKKVC